MNFDEALGTLQKMFQNIERDKIEAILVAQGNNSVFNFFYIINDKRWKY